MPISDAIKLKLAALVPQGYDVADAREVIASGRCEPLAALTPDEEVLLASVTETARGPKQITDGRPTLMRVVAWMVHEGVNLNRDAFVKEELAAAAAKITPRNPLVMDWNHAAVVGGQNKVIGVWTKADYAFDQKAKDGAGAWGLLVEGVMFAWLYPDLADAMLADQSRLGAVRFSMACIPASVEFASDANGPYAVLHNPVFFTNSALDVAPGDPDAKGLGKEAADAPNAEAELKQRLMSASAGWTLQNTAGTSVNYVRVDDGTTVSATLESTGVTTVTTTADLNGGTNSWSYSITIPPNYVWAPNTWDNNTWVYPPRVASLTDNQEALAQRIAALIAEKLAAQGEHMPKSAEELAADAAEAARLEKEAAAAEAAAAEAAAAEAAAAEAAAAEAAAAAARTTEERLAAIESKVTELETANTALRTENEALVAENAALTEQNTTLAAELQAIKDAAAEAAAAEQLAARLAELPETYLAAHRALGAEERAALETRWAALDDAAWAEKVADLHKAVPKSRISRYLDASQREGRLPNAGTAKPQSITDRVRNITRA